jgi:hypothetical protein
LSNDRKKEKVMNIQKLKGLNLLLWLLVLSSCLVVKIDKKVMNIYSGIEVENRLYKYSEESSLEINGVYYSLRQEAVYDEDGVLQKVISYRSEGILEYIRQNLLDDPELIKYWGFPLHQAYLSVNGELFLNENNDKAQKINDVFFKKKDENRIVIYKTK